MNPAGAHDDGIPRRSGRITVPPRSPSAVEDLSGANAAKADKLRRNALMRLARAHGLELRHTAYGYGLIDAARKRVDDRSDMTLDEVESWLAQT
jgi:hypothetical protein